MTRAGHITRAGRGRNGALQLCTHLLPMSTQNMVDPSPFFLPPFCVSPLGGRGRRRWRDKGAVVGT